MKKITSQTTLNEVLESPKAEEVLSKFNVPCITCPMMAMEMDKLTIGEICYKYHIDENEILKELNSTKK